MGWLLKASWTPSNRFKFTCFQLFATSDCQLFVKSALLLSPPVFFLLPREAYTWPAFFCLEVTNSNIFSAGNLELFQPLTFCSVLPITIFVKIESLIFPAAIWMHKPELNHIHNCIHMNLRHCHYRFYRSWQKSGRSDW